MAIDDEGSAYLLDHDTLYSLDLNTATATVLREANSYALNGGYPYGFAHDPNSEQFFVAEDGGGGLYTLNIVSGDFTLVATNTDYWVGSMAFDSNGNLWINGDGNQVSHVSIADFGDSANWNDSSALTPDVYSESIVVARAPSAENGGEGLANTGSGDVTPHLLGGVLAAGIALAIRRRKA